MGICDSKTLTSKLYLEDLEKVSLFEQRDSTL